MERLVNYSVVARKNPAHPEKPVMYYAQAQASGVMGTLEICERLQRECTLTRADTMAVLVALEDVVADGLKSGQIVRLGGLCSLQLSVNSRGTLTKEEFNPMQIKRSKVLFRSGNTLRNAIYTLSYREVPQLPKPGAAAPETGGGGDSGEVPGVGL